MSFYIIKKGSNNFWHTFSNNAKTVNISDFEAVLDSVAQTFNIQCLNGANVPQSVVSILDIIVIDETDASVEETFTDVEVLRARLVVLGYTPYLGAGNADSITGLIEEGTNVTITGTGTLADPYVINASGGGSQNIQQVLDISPRTFTKTEGDIDYTFKVWDSGIFELKSINTVTGVIYSTNFGGSQFNFQASDGSDNAVTDNANYGTALREFIVSTVFGTNTLSIRGKTSGSGQSDFVTPQNLPVGVYVMPVSVNGNFADADGEITISAGATNLGYTASPTNGIVTSDTGTDATLLLADTTDAGLLSPADKTKLNNTSGTNTGDNSVNTNANSYADAKVADAIADGVTTIAPSQNAVFDALALKQDVVSGVSDTEIGYLDGVTSPIQAQLDNRTKKIVNHLTASTAHTGTTIETQITSFAFQIPANTLSATDILRIQDIAWEKTGVANSSAVRIKINSTNNYATATTIATFSASAANTYARGCRTFKIVGGNLKGVLSTTTGIFNDFTLTNVGWTNTAIDVTNIIYGFVSVQLTNAADSVVIDELVITN